MPRPSSARALGVWMNGERVATWTLPSRAPQELAYDDDWLRSPDPRPLSLSMPTGPVGTSYRGAVVERYFDNLLPDSRDIRERIRERFAARSSGAFDLLSEIGRDCIGAVQLLPADEAPAEIRTIQGQLLRSADIERLLREMTNPLAFGGAQQLRDFRFSLAGAQEKIALLRSGNRWMRPVGTTPTTHILKLPIGEAAHGIDLGTSVENEWICARILDAYDIPVAPCRMQRFGEQLTLVVERFDRRLSADGSWILRLPQEDLCQACGAGREQKYEDKGGPGIRAIMNVLLGSARAEQDRLDFFRTQIVFWMLCAIDGHAKNFSLFIEAGGRFRLTPRYDVLSAFPVLGRGARQLPRSKLKMAMAVEGKNRHYAWQAIQRRHWEETARRCGIAAFWPSVLNDLLGRTSGVIDAVAAELPKGFPARVADPILKGLESSARLLAD